MIATPIDTDGLIANPIDSTDCADTNVLDDDIDVLTNILRLVLWCKWDDVGNNELLAKRNLLRVECVVSRNKNSKHPKISM